MALSEEALHAVCLTRGVTPEDPPDSLSPPPACRGELLHDFTPLAAAGVLNALGPKGFCP